MSVRSLLAATISIATLWAASNVGRTLPPDGDTPIAVWMLMVLAITVTGLVVINAIVGTAFELRGSSLAVSVARGVAITGAAWLVTVTVGVLLLNSAMGDAEPAPSWSSSPLIAVLAVLTLTWEALLLARILARSKAATRPA